MGMLGGRFMRRRIRFLVMVVVAVMVVAGFVMLVFLFVRTLLLLMMVMVMIMMVVIFPRFVGMRVAVAMPMLMPISGFIMAAIMAGVTVAMPMIRMGKVDIELGAADARAFLAGEVEMAAIDMQGGQLLFQPGKINAQVDQGAQQHVAADAAEQVQKEGIRHNRNPLVQPRPARALIWLAAKPAPKPLSMFTTSTPLPQLLSMPSRAATPPKLAP